MRPAHGKDDAQIAREWNAVAELRARQIRERKDISFHRVLLPYILKTSTRSDLSSVVDVGCGTGFVSRELDRLSPRVIGVDLSAQSIETARAEAAKENDGNLAFVNASVEEYATSELEGSFTLAVANMTLSAVASLDATVRAVARLLAPGGHLIFTITHPCFWPLYWGYAEAEWFDYKSEIFIEAPFRISLESRSAPVTTHVHRPLERYIETLLAAGLRIAELAELKPTPDVEKMYPHPWKYPRFIGARCIRE